MSGLLLKDIYGLNKNIKQYGISCVVFIILAIYMKSSIYFVYMMMLVSSMLIYTSLSYDEVSKWDKYALTMPIERKEIVLSKYVLLSILLFGGVLISIIVGMVLSYLFSYESSKTIIITSISGIGILYFFFSILLPIVFKYGVEKGRILIYVVIAIPTFIAGGGARILEKLNINMPTFGQVKPYLYFLPAFLLLLVFLSYKASLSIYEKKEF